MRGADRTYGRAIHRQIPTAEDVAVNVGPVGGLRHHGHVRVGAAVRGVHSAQIIQQNHLGGGAVDLRAAQHDLAGVARIETRHAAECARQQVEGAAGEDRDRRRQRPRIVAAEGEVGEAVGVDIARPISRFAEGREINDVVGLRGHKLKPQRRERPEEDVSLRAAIDHEVVAPVTVEITDIERVGDLLIAVHALDHERLVDLRILAGTGRVGNVDALVIGRGRRGQGRRRQVEAIQPLHLRRNLAGGIKERHEGQAVKHAQGRAQQLRQHEVRVRRDHDHVGERRAAAHGGRITTHRAEVRQRVQRRHDLRRRAAAIRARADRDDVAAGALQDVELRRRRARAERQLHHHIHAAEARIGAGRREGDRAAREGE